VQFWKVESIGNDFVLIHLSDLENVEGAPSADFQLASLAVQMCDRKFGIGGDGLLAVEKSDTGIVLRMFNPDGTEDFCGNGIRCAALHAQQEGWVATSFTVTHLGREVAVQIGDDGCIATTLPPASYDPDKVPLIGRRIFNETVWSGMDSGMPLSLFGSGLTTGSTHVIIPTAQLPDDDTFQSVSPKIEHDEKFPERTSVIWSQEIESNVLQIRIWERGVGETLGCGTGSAAAAIDYLRRKNRGGRVEVRNPGGTVFVTAETWESPILIEGSAHVVYKGRFRNTATP